MKQPRGFIALISSIILSMILLLVAADASSAGFYGRADALDAELKERSESTAAGCVHQALLQISTNPSYSGTFTANLNLLDQCQAMVTDQNSQKSITVHATSSDAVTNLLVLYDPRNQHLVSWLEVPN